MVTTLGWFYLIGGTILFFFWAYGIVSFALDCKNKFIPAIRRFVAARRERKRESERERKSKRESERKGTERQLDPEMERQLDPEETGHQLDPEEMERQLERDERERQLY